MTGARARISIEGRIVAICMSVSYSEQYQIDPVEPLGQLEAAELLEIAYRVSGSIGISRLVGQPAKLRDGVRIFPTIEEAINQPEKTLLVEDKITGTPLARIQRVKFTTNDNSHTKAHSITNLSFTGIYIRDESEVRR